MAGKVTARLPSHWQRVADFSSLTTYGLKSWNCWLWVTKKLKASHTCYRALGPDLIPVYRQSARRWVIHPAVGCHYFPPGLRLPSQLQSITASWPVTSYTAWWQSHIGVNNLPKVFMQLLPRIGIELTTCWSQVQRSTCCATAPPCVYVLSFKRMLSLQIFRLFTVQKWFFISKRQRITLRLLYAMSRSSVVCRLSVCLSSVTLVHPTQAVELFGNIFSPYDSPGTLLLWCQKSLVGNAPFPLKFAFKVTHPPSNSEISTNIGS